MSKGSDTKQSIVDEALNQARRVGLEGVTLGELATSVQLSKSGLFAHFKSKEALQLAVLEEAIDQFTSDVIAPSLSLPRGSERLQSLFERYVSWITDKPWDAGCIFISLSQEYDDRPGPVRDRLVESENQFQDVIRRVAQGAAERAGVDSFDADQFVYEFKGIGLNLQHVHRLLRDPKGCERAHKAFAHLRAHNGI